MRVTSTVALVCPKALGTRNLTLSTAWNPASLPKASSEISVRSAFLRPLTSTAWVVVAALACSPKAYWIHSRFFEYHSLAARSLNVTTMSPLGIFLAAIAPCWAEA